MSAVCTNHLLGGLTGTLLFTKKQEKIHPRHLEMDQFHLETYNHHH